MFSPEYEENKSFMSKINVVKILFEYQYLIVSRAGILLHTQYYSPAALSAPSHQS